MPQRSYRSRYRASEIQTWSRTLAGELLLRASELSDDLSFLQNGESALHAASLFGHLKIVKELVGAGAKASLKNKVCNLVS
jgi:ankyrin repeat protein